MPYTRGRVHEAIYKTAFYVVAGFTTAVSKMAEYTTASIAADCLSLRSIRIPYEQNPVKLKQTRSALKIVYVKPLCMN